MNIDFIFNEAATVVKKHLEENSKREASVVRFMPPKELLKVMDFSLPSEPESHDKLLECVKKVLEYSIQAGKYYNVRVSTCVRDCIFYNIWFISAPRVGTKRFTKAVTYCIYCRGQEAV